MQYLFLLFRDETEPMTSEQSASAVSRQWAILDETAAKGIFRGASPLPRNAPAITVRPNGASTVVTDGPFAETKEALGGFYVIECADWEEAQYWAGRMAQTGCTNKIEVRPLMAIPSRLAAECSSTVHA
jgi:hypothetical protein